jgi:outer membrane usher protein FimD/PapC
MRRGLFVLLSAVVIATAAFAAPAMATSPHFINASAARAGDNLVVSFKEAGLGTNQLITYQADASATRVDSCVNGGGKVPSDAKKTTTQADVSATGTFNSGKNGSVTGSLTITPPATTLSCPSGQTATLISLTYTNVSITDTTNDVTEPIPGTF